MDSRPDRIRLVIIILGCIMLALAIHPWDIKLSGFVRNYPIRGDFNKFLQLCEAGAHFMTIAYLFSCLAWTDVKNRTKLYVGMCFVMIAGAVANTAKLIIPRLRPNAMDHLSPEVYPTSSWQLWGSPLTGPWFDEGMRSFPSGHSATAMAVAFSLTYVYPRGKWFFIVIALFACLQRVQCGAHYFTDVLGGIACTSLCAYLYLPVFYKFDLERQQNLSCAGDDSVSATLSVPSSHPTSDSNSESATSPA